MDGTSGINVYLQVDDTERTYTDILSKPDLTTCDMTMMEKYRSTNKNQSRREVFFSFFP